MNNSEPKGLPPVTRRGFLHGAAGAAALSAVSYERVLGANDRVGVGFIGFGLIGNRHVIDFKEQADAAPVAVAEAHRGRLDQARSTIGGAVAGYSDFRKLLDSKDIQAVVVSTPDHWHALMMMLACAAGKDVYTEKPMTLFIREGRWMAEVAKRTGRVVQVGTQQRSGPHYQAARKLLQSGHIGKVLSVRMAAYRNIMPGFGAPPDGPPPAELDWNAFLGPAPMRPYNPNRGIYHFRWFWDTSGGQMTNLGHHSLDIVHWYLGTDPVAVTSAGGRFALTDNGETPDTQDAIIEYPGFTAIWSHREASGRGFGGSPLEFFGTKGSLSVTRGGYQVTADLRVSPNNRVPQASGAGHPVGGPQRDTNAGPSEPWTTAAQDRSGSERDQFKRHVRNFVDCVKSRQQPISDVESGHRVSTVSHLANLSLRLGRQLRWDAAKEEIIGDAEANRMLVRPYRAPWDAELKALNVGGTP